MRRRPPKPSPWIATRRDATSRDFRANVALCLLVGLVLASNQSYNFFLPTEPDSATARRALATESTSEVADWRRPPGAPKPDQRWGLWPALPIAPYERRVTLRYEVIPGMGAQATYQLFVSGDALGCRNPKQRGMG